MDVRSTSSSTPSRWKTAGVRTRSTGSGDIAAADAIRGHQANRRPRHPKRNPQPFLPGGRRSGQGHRPEALGGDSDGSLDGPLGRFRLSPRCHGRRLGREVRPLLLPLQGRRHGGLPLQHGPLRPRGRRQLRGGHGDLLADGLWKAGSGWGGISSSIDEARPLRPRPRRHLRQGRLATAAVLDPGGQPNLEWEPVGTPGRGGLTVNFNGTVVGGRRGHGRDNGHDRGGLHVEAAQRWHARVQLVPELGAFLSFDDVTDSSPSWLDISDRVLDFEIGSGRTTELDDIQTGRRRSPSTTRRGTSSPGTRSSPYAPNVIANRRLRLEADGFPRFYGYVDTWIPEGTSYGMATVRIEASDGFKLLEKAKLPAPDPTRRRHPCRAGHVRPALGALAAQ